MPTPVVNSCLFEGEVGKKYNNNPENGKKCLPYKLIISFGRKNVKMTRRHQQIIFIIHPPWCKPSRGSLWLFTPTIKTAKIVKKRKFPKLTRNTASVSNHSLLGVWLKLLIPASTKDTTETVTKIDKQKAA